MTAYKPRRAGSLRQALAALVEACGGNAAAAVILGFKGPNHVQRLTDDGADNARHRVSLEQVAKLQAASGSIIVTRWLAEQQGCIVEPLHVKPLDPVSVVVGRITSETGDVLSAAAADMARCALTPATARLVMKETDDLLPAILELRAGCRAVIEAAP
ncbi:MAG: hypothetical protein JO256_09165 [Alphaproteobacteria bacterium]|nr:hypothetical protein [Alphaproteobacteria bacterium]